jgi:hypothetical protein
MPYSEPMFNRGEMSMNVILDAREELESELKVFTENRVKFSLKRLFWMVRKIKIQYTAVASSKTNCNQHCTISLETFDHHQIEVSMTARDKRMALEMCLKKIYKLVQKAFHKSQQYGRFSKHVYA